MHDKDLQNKTTATKTTIGAKCTWDKKIAIIDWGNAES